MRETRRILLIQLSHNSKLQDLTLEYLYIRQLSSPTQKIYTHCS